MQHFIHTFHNQPRRLARRAMQELPTISGSSYSGNLYDITNSGITLTSGTGTMMPATDWSVFQNQLKPYQQPTVEELIESLPMSNRRIVQVFIADPNDNVPLEKSILHQDEKPHLTDLTDQELFFEIDIKNALDKHNEYRVTLTDKEASKGKNNDVKLEKAKIRDLKMTVVTVAQF